MKLQNILLDSDYALDIFSQDCIERLESKIITKETKTGALAYYIPCLIRNKEIKLTPEEIIRQLYLDKLINEYQYPKSRIQVEYAVHFGREVKRADIVIMDKLQITSAYIIIEVKKPKLKDGKEQPQVRLWQYGAMEAKLAIIIAKTQIISKKSPISPQAIKALKIFCKAILPLQI